MAKHALKCASWYLCPLPNGNISIEYAILLTKSSHNTLKLVRIDYLGVWLSFRCIKASFLYFLGLKMRIIWLKSLYTGFVKEIRPKNEDKNQVLKKNFLSKIFEISFTQNVPIGPFWRFSMIFDPQNMDFESLSNLKFPCQKPPF